MTNSFRSKKEETEKHPTRYYSDKQEKSVAKAIGGKQTANSGATAYQKGDVSSENWLYECKTKMTDVNSISIKKEWLEKNLQESVYMGKKYNALVFNFGPNSKNYYVIDENTFKELMDNNKD